MKRAIFLCPSPYAVGTYYRTFAFARAFVRNAGYEVDLLCTEYDSEVNGRGRGRGAVQTMVDGVNIIQSRMWGPSALPLRGWNFGELLNRIAYVRGRGTQYDLVYSFEYQPNVASLAFPLAKIHRALHLNDWCDWYAGRHHKMKGIRILQRLDGWMEELPRRHVDGVTTICQSIYDRALQSGVSSEKLLMVREGADGPLRMTSRTEARRALGLSDNEFWIVALSDQDPHVLIEGILSLQSKRPEARLALIGDLPRGRKFPEWMKTPGRVPDEELHLWFSAADCAWLPLEDTLLNRGRLPHKIGHFRMYGLPLVTTPVSDVPLLGDPGIYIVSYTAESFAAETMQLSALDQEERLVSQKQARTVFDWDGVMRPLLDRVVKLFELRQ